MPFSVQGLVRYHRFFRFIFAPLVSVGRAAVLVPGLHIVMVFAQRSPVARVPEQPRVSPMRFYVVYHCRLRVSSFRQTHLTQRVRFKITLPRSLPRTAISPRVCRTNFLWVQSLMLLAVPLADFYQFGTARMLTWHSRLLRHFLFPLLCTKKETRHFFRLVPCLLLSTFFSRGFVFPRLVHAITISKNARGFFHVFTHFIFTALFSRYHSTRKYKRVFPRFYSSDSLSKFSHYHYIKNFK